MSTSVTNTPNFQFRVQFFTCAGTKHVQERAESEKATSVSTKWSQRVVVFRSCVQHKAFRHYIGDGMHSSNYFGVL